MSPLDSIRRQAEGTMEGALGLVGHTGGCKDLGGWKARARSCWSGFPRGGGALLLGWSLTHFLLRIN